MSYKKQYRALPIFKKYAAKCYIFARSMIGG